MISCVPIIYFEDICQQRKNFADLASLLRSMGAEAVEAHYKFFPDLSESTLRDARAQVEGEGVLFSQFCAAPDFTNPEPKGRKKTLEEFRRQLEAAVFLGCPCIRTTVGQRWPEVMEEEAVRWAEEGINDSLSHARKLGVEMALEDHWKDYYWDFPDWGFDSRVFLKVLRDLSEEGLRVNFDTSNPVCAGEDPVPLLDEVKALVVNIHLSDREEIGQRRHAELGRGVVDFPAIFGILADIGYKGWIAVEYNGQKGDEGLRESIDFARKMEASYLAGGTQG
jgi:sugar phosphate isomerase/epimerase